MLIILPLQRFAVPLGSQQIPVGLLLLISLIGWGLRKRIVEIDRTSLLMYCFAGSALVVLTLVALARHEQISLFSLIYVLVLYPLAAVALPGLTQPEVTRIHKNFVDCMSLAAVVGIGQMLVQLIGLPWQDWLKIFVPSGFLLRDYNTGNPVTYGSPLYRSNAIVFLEPSFYSFFLGLAVIFALYYRRRTRVVVVLLAGLVPAVAGNGIVICGLGALALAFGRHRSTLKILVFPAIVAIGVAALTPLGSIILGRSHEVGSSGSSSSQRFVEPYQALLPQYSENATTVLIGRGAGSAVRGLLHAGFEGAVVTPVVPKLLFEYGALGAIPFLFFVLYSVWGGRGERPWGLALLVGYLVLNPAFLQTTLAIATIMFGRMLRGPDPELIKKLQRSTASPLGG